MMQGCVTGRRQESHVEAVFAEQIGLLDLDYILQISKKSQMLVSTLYKTEKENVDCP